MHRILLTMLLLIAAGAAGAGISDYYSFQPAFGTYTVITGTSIPSLQADDYLSSALPLGFMFPYGPYSYNAIKICSNGWIGLGISQTEHTFMNNLASPALCPIVAPLWDDLSMVGGNVQYLLSGTAPDRVFTVQFSDAHWPYSFGMTVDFQVILHESGLIEFVYGPSEGEGQNCSASIGINMLPGGSGNFYSVTPGYPSTASTTVEDDGVSVFPFSGDIFRFVPVPIFSNDLAALAVACDPNLYPVVGTPINYSVTVRNSGLSAQTNFQVSLYHGNGDLIGNTMAVNTLAPGASWDYLFSWTPLVAGSDTLYGQVFLEGDQNPENNRTPDLPVVVQPAGQHTVSIGAGDQTARIPMDFYWKNSLFQCLYYPSELNFNGTITALEFYNDFNSLVPAKQTYIWLGTTLLPDLGGGMISSLELTSVFSGLVEYPLGENTIHIDLQTPFEYESGNLVLLVHRPMDSEYYSTADVFVAQTVGNNRARKAYSDNTVYNPAAPPTNATLSGQFPKTTIYYLEDTAVGDPVTPELSYGIVSVSPNPFHASVSVTCKVERTGSAKLEVYNLRGQKIRTFDQAGTGAGTWIAAWDGKDSRGNQVGPGIYFIRLSNGKNQAVAKLLRL